MRDKIDKALDILPENCGVCELKDSCQLEGEDCFVYKLEAVLLSMQGEERDD